MSQNLKNIDIQVSKSEYKSLLNRTRFAREWKARKPNALSEILSLAKRSSVVREAIIEDTLEKKL